jgi:nucleotide-binding universal stress UspA family protein
MRLERILVPIDFSDCSPYLLAEAIKMARQLGARLTLLHVIEPPDGLLPETPIQPDPNGEVTTLSRFLSKAAQSRMPEFEKFCEDAGVPHSSRIRVARVADGILDETDGHDLLMMGTHGRQGIARVVLGSVAEQVTRRSDIPVMTVRTRHRPTCEAGACKWCSTHVKLETIAAAAEGVG